MEGVIADPGAGLREGAAHDATLDQLAAGECAVVAGVNGAGLTRRRLLEMGLVRGTPVRVVRRAPLGDPLELDVAGYRLSLRREVAAHIHVLRSV